MKKTLILALAIMLSTCLLTTEVYAKRFGGGKSFGKQSQQVTPPAAPKPVGQPIAPAGGRSWLGPLAGLAAGGLLASMFMGHGFDGLKMFDMLLIVALGLGIYFLFRRMRQTQAPQPLQYAGMPPPVFSAPPAFGSAVASNTSNTTRPDWFEDEPFLRAAKGHYIRLQEANDRGDLQDIREYTTPEVFAEIQLQLQERGNAKNKTDILQLNADMIDVVTEENFVIASVRFTGLIREDEGAASTALNEIWHIQKSTTDQNASWFVAGIQQA